jgi:hypothetical protein
VREHGELAGAYPKLQQPRVDIHQCAAPNAGEQSGIDRVVKVQQEIRPPQNRLGFGPRAADEMEGTRTSVSSAVERVKESFSFEPESLHPLEEGRDHVGLPFRIGGGSELLQPVDLAA